MRKSRTGLFVLAALLILMVPGQAHAYIDPGTTSSLFAILAPIIALFGVFLGYLLWPFRYMLKGIFHKKSAEPEGEAEAENGAGAEPAEQE